MKFKLIFLLLFPIAHLFGQTFPSITVEDIHSKKLELPKDLEGKKSILFLAFTAQAETMLDDWYEPVYITFLDKSGFNAMTYDANVKLIMLFTGATQSAAKSVKQKISENIDPEMENLLLFFEGDFHKEMDALNIKKKNDAYVVVLDENGKILATETAEYSDKKLDRIADMVEL